MQGTEDARMNDEEQVDHEHDNQDGHDQTSDNLGHGGVSLSPIHLRETKHDTRDEQHANFIEKLEGHVVSALERLRLDQD